MTDYSKMDGVFGIGEGDEKIEARGNHTKFKGKEGESYRLSIAWWPMREDGLLNLDAKTPFFLGEKRLFLAGVGYFFDKGPEYIRLAGGKESRPSVITVVIKWPANKRGVLDKARFAAGDYEVMPWIFAPRRYNEIKDLHEEWGLGHHDLKATCTDTQYQKMSLITTKESCLRTLLEAPKRQEQAKQISEEVAELAKNIRRELGQDLTIEQIKERLGQATEGGGGATAEEMSMDDVDDMINDLLDDE